MGTIFSRVEFSTQVQVCIVPFFNVNYILYYFSRELLLESERKILPIDYDDLPDNLQLELCDSPKFSIINATAATKIFRGDIMPFSIQNLLLESEKNFTPIKFARLPENIQDQLRDNPQYFNAKGDTTVAIEDLSPLSNEAEECQITFNTPINPKTFLDLNGHIASKVVTLDCVVESISNSLDVQAINFDGNLSDLHKKYNKKTWVDVQRGRIKQRTEIIKNVNVFKSWYILKY